MEKKACSLKLADHIQLGVYLGPMNGLCRIYLLNGKRKMHPKQLDFYEQKLRIVTTTVTNRRVDIRQKHLAQD